VKIRESGIDSFSKTSNFLKIFWIIEQKNSQGLEGHPLPSPNFNVGHDVYFSFIYDGAYENEISE
jgi:hypothetical protein